MPSPSDSPVREQFNFKHIDELTNFAHEVAVQLTSGAELDVACSSAASYLHTPSLRDALATAVGIVARDAGPSQEAYVAFKQFDPLFGAVLNIAIEWGLDKMVALTSYNKALTAISEANKLTPQQQDGTSAVAFLSTLGRLYDLGLSAAVSIHVAEHYVAAEIQPSVKQIGSRLHSGDSLSGALDFARATSFLSAATVEALCQAEQHGTLPSACALRVEEILHPTSA